MWRGNACKARKWAPMESRKLARRGPRSRSSSRAESEGFQRGRGRGEEGGRGYWFERKKEGPRPMQGGGPRVQGRGREQRLKGGPIGFKKKGRVYARKAEPKRRGGARALGL
jgi:hypothetical protein